MCDNLKETELCDCKCHHQGMSIMHCMPCCDMTYVEYIIDCKVNISIYSKEFKKIHNAIPTIKSDNDKFYLVHK